MKIAEIGGTGNEGSGLARRWARAGHTLFIGSRDAERAKKCADELHVGGAAFGGENGWAAAQAELVVVAVPYAAHGDTFRALRGIVDNKVVLDITVPLQPPKVSQVHLPPGQSAALEAQEILGPGARVAAALHHISYAHLADPNFAIDCDVLVCSNDDAARATVIALVADLGLRGLDSGVLRNAIALESLTSVLIHLNKKYKSAGTGIRITGLPPKAP